MKMYSTLFAVAFLAVACNSSSDTKTGKDNTVVTEGKTSVAPPASQDTTAAPMVDTSAPTNTGDTSLP